MSETVAAIPTGQVDSYRLLQPLGKGGMGEVWLAEDPSGARWVIKRLLPAAAQDPRFLKRFLLEGRYASLLHHPNVVGVRAVGEWEDLPYLVLEYVDGTDLRKVKKGARARRELPPIGAVVDAILQACHGLHAAHELADPETGKPLRLMHRDVSPDNLLLDRTGTVRISDFGIARAEGQALTSNGALWGKHSYMAPERLQGKEADRRVDIFSLGVVFFEMLALERPFSSKAKGGAIAAVLFEKPRSLARLVPDLPPAIIAVIEKMLEKEPADRFSTMAEVAEALEAARAGTELPGVSADLLELAEKSAPDAAEDAGDEPRTRASRGRSRAQRVDAQDAGASGPDDSAAGAEQDEDDGATRDQATEANAKRHYVEPTAPLPAKVLRQLEAVKAERTGSGPSSISIASGVDKPMAPAPAATSRPTPAPASSPAPTGDGKKPPVLWIALGGGVLLLVLLWALFA